MVRIPGAKAWQTNGPRAVRDAEIAAAVLHDQEVRLGEDNGQIRVRPGQCQLDVERSGATRAGKLIGDRLDLRSGSRIAVPQQRIDHVHPPSTPCRYGSARRAADGCARRCCPGFPSAWRGPGGRAAARHTGSGRYRAYNAARNRWTAPPLAGSSVSAVEAAMLAIRIRPPIRGRSAAAPARLAASPAASPPSNVRLDTSAEIMSIIAKPPPPLPAHAADLRAISIVSVARSPALRCRLE